ncbi:hypothetical protein [Neochlamydia sp. S13]|uniref:hypothetical protein n=1 Tax=Neochlamydia sp. S13 TaxID=1353976 RepID=UPI0013156C63|nr:hypothetical protein [Neochlamydia sp. S13]
MNASSERKKRRANVIIGIPQRTSEALGQTESALNLGTLVYHCLNIYGRPIECQLM